MVFPYFSLLCADVNCDFVLILIIYRTTTYYYVLFNWRCMHVWYVLLNSTYLLNQSINQSVLIMFSATLSVARLIAPTSSGFSDALAKCIRTVSRLRMFNRTISAAPQSASGSINTSRRSFLLFLFFVLVVVVVKSIFFFCFLLLLLRLFLVG